MCKIKKEEVDFTKKGLRCKMCVAIYQKKYRNNHQEELSDYFSEHYNKNKEEKLSYQKEYYDHNKEDRLSYQKEYRNNNQEDIVPYMINYYIVNKDEIADQKKIYYKNNKDEISIRQKKYRDNNKKEISSYKRSYEKERYKNDPSYRLRNIVSASVRQVLKTNNSSKNGNSIVQYLGYTIDELKVYLENQFEPWMTWDNHGIYNPNTWDDNVSATWTWQIDHIIPHSKFQYTSMEDQAFLDCWALSNLRPYSAKQNIIDGNRVIK